MGNGVAPGGLRGQAATGCGRYEYTVRNRTTAAWDARAPLHASRKIPLAVVYVLAGMLAATSVTYWTWSCTMSASGRLWLDPRGVGKQQRVPGVPAAGQGQTR